MNILPVAVQCRMMQHLDRLKTYAEVREKVVSVVQSARGPDDIDCSNLGIQPGWHDEEEYWPGVESDETDVGVLATVKWHKCGGMGHSPNPVGKADRLGEQKGIKGWRKRRERAFGKGGFNMYGVFGRRDM